MLEHRDLETLPAGRRAGRALGAVAASFAAILTALLAGGCGEGPPPSVVLVTIDTLRADHAGGRGEAPGRSGIDRLRRRGTSFENAFAPGAATAPSHASILTGRYASFHTVGLLNGRYPLDPETPTLAARLQAEGFATGAVVSNPVLRRRLGLARGFDHYDDEFESLELVRKIPERYADRAVDLAIEWLSRRPDDEPTFLWLHLQDPHGPYVPPDPALCDEAVAAGEVRLPFGDDTSGYRAIPNYQRLEGEQRAAVYRRRYDCEAAYADHHLDRLLDHLAANPRWEETLIVLTADHGEAMGEDGFWFAHSHSVGRDQVHVPLMVAGPGVPAGRTVEAPVSNVWVKATVLDFLGLEPPPGVETTSLLALAEGDAEPPPVFFESVNQSGVAHRGLFLRRDRRPPSDRAFWEAPNPLTGGAWVPLGRQAIRLGGGEATIGAADERELARRLDAFDRRARAARREIAEEQTPATFSDEERSVLRSLGYVD